VAAVVQESVDLHTRVDTSIIESSFMHCVLFKGCWHSTGKGGFKFLSAYSPRVAMYIKSLPLLSLNSDMYSPRICICQFRDRLHGYALTDTYFTLSRYLYIYHLKKIIEVPGAPWSRKSRKGSRWAVCSSAS
jgi:hypothetical protein